MQPTVADRNNNPGNLRDPSTGSFRTFSSPDEGYAALLNDVQGKMTGATSTGLSGNSTLYDFAKVYAPSGDSNDPAQYTANLANSLGVAPNTPLSQLQPRIGDVAQAIAKNEGYTAASGFVATAPDVSQGSVTAPAADPTGSGTPDLPSYGAAFPASPNDNPLVAGLKAAGNLPGSAYGFGKGIFDAVTHPIDTVKALGETAIGGAEKLTGQAPDANTQTFDSFVKVLADRYGGLDQLQNTATNDPFGFATDIASLASGGAGLAGKSAELTDLAGSVARTAIKPLEGTAATIADTAKGVGAYATSKITGLEPGTISEIVRNPTAFTPEAIANANRADIATEVGSALTDRISALQDTGTGYDATRALQAPNLAIDAGETKMMSLGGGKSLVYNLVDAPDEILTLPELRKKVQLLQGDPTAAPEALRQSNATLAARTLTETIPHTIKVPKSYVDSAFKDAAAVDITNGKIAATGASKVRTASDVSKLQNLYDLWKPVFAKGNLTTDEFLNFRSDLAKAANYEGGVGKSSAIEAAAKTLRANLNTRFRPQIPGLDNLDASYEKQISELQALRKGIIDKDGNLTDASINKIANATGKGKDQLLARLEQIVPGITKRIKIQKAMEDIAAASGNKVGTYTKTALETGGIVGGLMTGNIPLVAGALAAAIAATPEVAVPLLRAYGMNKALVSNVMARLGVSGKIGNLPALTGASEVSRALAPGQSSAQIPDITPAAAPVVSPIQDTAPAAQVS